MSFVQVGSGIYRSAVLNTIGWLEHGFGNGAAGDWLANQPVACLNQVHSDVVVNAGGRTGKLCEGDALIIETAGTWVAVRTADCVPVILADARRRVVAVVHSGWRGTAAAIVPKTVERMRADFSISLKDLHAAIGPAIGGCCYEVGAEVMDRMSQWETVRGMSKLALDRVILKQLTQLGVAVEQIDLSELCTCCGGSQFESFRRDGALAGRMVAAARVRPPNAKTRDRSPAF